MKKFFLIISLLMLTMFLCSCGLETAKQHDERVASESESRNEKLEAESKLANETVSETAAGSTNNLSANSQNSTAAANTNQVTNNTVSSSSDVADSSVSTSNGDVNNSTPASNPSNNTTSTTTNTTPAVTSITVTVRITCQNINQPDVLADYTVTINSNESVYDATVKACNENYIPLIDNGSGYIKSINLIEQKQYGDQSGWKYKINNANPPGVACNNYKKLQNGDTIEWFYALTINATS